MKHLKSYKIFENSLSHFEKSALRKQMLDSGEITLNDQSAYNKKVKELDDQAIIDSFDESERNGNLPITLSNGESIDRKEIEDNIGKISKHYGTATMDDISSALNQAHYTRHLDKMGGTLYRVLFMESPDQLDINNIGHHWIEDMSDANDVADHFHFAHGHSKNKNNKPYIVVAETPLGNTTFAEDYWNNLEESEIKVIDPSKMKILHLLGKKPDGRRNEWIKVTEF